MAPQFNSSVESNSLQPHGLQHIRLPCPSPSPGFCSNSCTPSQWCRPTISSSVIPFSSYLQSFPASGSFLISQLFKSGGQSVGASALASVLPKNIQNWLPLGLTGWILAVQGTLKSLLQHHISFLSFFLRFCWFLVIFGYTGSLLLPSELVAPWDVGSSCTRDWTCVPGIARQTLSHWTMREALQHHISKASILKEIKEDTNR